MNIGGLVRTDFLTVPMSCDVFTIRTELMSRGYAVAMFQNGTFAGILTPESAFDNASGKVSGCVLQKGRVDASAGLEETISAMAQVKAHYIGVFRGDAFAGVLALSDLVGAMVSMMDDYRRSEERYGLLIEMAQDIIYTVSPDGIVKSINSNITPVTGWEASEMIGTNFINFMHPAEFELAYKYHLMIQSGMTPPRFELKFKKKNGEFIDAEYSTTPIIKDGQVLGTLGIAHDITERKRSERMIREALAKEQELNRLKTQFISMVSHDFRTPLTVVNSVADYLSHFHHELSGPKFNEQIIRIKKVAAKMNELLDDVLLISQLESQNYIVNPAPCDIVAFCEELAAEMRLAAVSGVALEFGRPSGAPWRIAMDLKALGRILTNLLSNAMKYSHQNGKVFFGLSFESGWVVFRVRDEGIGIPEADQLKIYGLFHRASNVGHVQGTGLGLAIANRFASLIGGELTFRSAAGEGTEFTLRVPVKTV